MILRIAPALTTAPTSAIARWSCCWYMEMITSRSAWLPTATMDGPGSHWWTLRNSAPTPALRESSGERCQWKVSHPWGRYIGLMQAEEQAEIARRLRSAGGHLEAITGMLEAGEPCEPILHQLG